MLWPQAIEPSRLGQGPGEHGVGVGLEKCVYFAYPHDLGHVFGYCRHTDGANRIVTALCTLASRPTVCDV